MRKLLAGLCTLLLIGGLAACSSKDGDDATTTTKVAKAATTTTAAGGNDETTTTAGDDSGDDAQGGAYASSLATGLSSGDPDNGDLELSQEEADCVAPRWIEIIGEDTLVDKDVKPADLEDPDYTYSDLGMDEDQGLEMIDAFVDCDVNIYEQLDEVLTSDLDETKAKCLRDEMDKDLIRQFLAQAIIADQPTDELQSKLDAIDKKCGLSEK